MTAIPAPRPRPAAPLTARPRGARSSLLPLVQSDQPVAAARHHTRQVLADWGWEAADDLVDTAVLVASELVTNAVRHTADGPVDLRLTASPSRGRLRISVRDTDPALPQARHSDPDAETGRGMAIVCACSLSHGCTISTLSGRKTVWAALRLTTPAARSPQGADPADPRPKPSAARGKCRPNQANWAY